MVYRGVLKGKPVAALELWIVFFQRACIMDWLPRWSHYMTVLFYFRACGQKWLFLERFRLFPWLRTLLMLIRIGGLQNIKRWNRNVVINEERAWNTWLILNFCDFIELFLPFSSFGNGLWVWSIGDDNASWNMPCVQRLERRLRVNVVPLVPQLHPNLLALNLQNF